MDFLNIGQRQMKTGGIEIYPDFTVKRSRDLMVRGKSFYAIWDEESGLWSTDEYDVQRLVDKELLDYKEQLEKKYDTVHVRLMSNFSSYAWRQFRLYLAQIPDNSHQLDNSITFADTEVKKTDYISRRLPYTMKDGSIEAYDELMSTLYLPDERQKLEWAIGSVISGDSKTIQKFITIYGEGGSGKSTFLNILQKLFEGYFTTFEAKELTSNRNAFSTESFKGNPLVAIQHDGDLSKIDDNTKLNSIVSHELMTWNEKFKPQYSAKANCFLFMATNKPVRITDGKSGLIRRLIDVVPSGNKVQTLRYLELMTQIDFELGAIAAYCLKVYSELGKNYYYTYKPLTMQLSTDVFFNFVDYSFYQFLEQDGVSLSQAYALYKEFCKEALIEYPMPRHRFRDELKNYFIKFEEVTRINSVQVRSYFSGFKVDKFKKEVPEEPRVSKGWISIDKDISLLDSVLAGQPAQKANKYELPTRAWNKTTTVLSDIDTRVLHYVKLPENHVVIDFDIRDSDGNKSLNLNLEEANKFRETYVEVSKSGAGLHLHYIWSGECPTNELARLYSNGVEIKTFTGDASLRRLLTKCNDKDVAVISSGLPIKEKKVINGDSVKSERALRDLIKRNLRKEIHPNTKPSIDFIYTILEEAYNSGMEYNVSDMQQKILVFAMHSTNQKEYCLELVQKMKFKSEGDILDGGAYEEDRVAFFDVEVFPNLFVICWKWRGKDNKPVHMINPTAEEVGELFKLQLIGFNCRRYDNHILYAAFLGYNNEELFKLSTSIIEGKERALFGEAYNISYADVYDFSSKKQSLKKFEIELGIHHLELGLPFDKPISDNMIPRVVEYCDNDVVATETVFDDRQEDFVARQILADLSGLTVNHTTQQHAAKIIFENDPNPQELFVYTDLSELFPGYKFELGKSSYKGVDPGEGGYVYAEPGYYENVALLDVASMHPTSIIQLDMFGPYTDIFASLVMARLAIKNKEFSHAKKMLNGVLARHLESVEKSKDLAYALKIIINIVYGLTSAKFPNKFKDPRNVDNIVAKRGALFMIELKEAVQKEGYQVAHIKTDSIKIPNADEKIIKFVCEFGKKYGYTFEHETTFDKFVLVNDAVYIGRDKDGWHAVGAEFQHPYIFKSLFSKEPIEFKDLCEARTVTTEMYLDMNEDLSKEQHNYVFIGKTGLFCPVVSNGGILYRKKEDKYYAVGGTKGYRWQISEVVKELYEDNIDMNYFNNLAGKAVEHIEQYVNYESLLERNQT